MLSSISTSIVITALILQSNINHFLTFYYRFMQVLLPCDDQYLRSAATQRPTYTIGRYDRLPSTVERELVNLLEREIAYHTRVERVKHELQLRYDWTTRAAFETIDTLREGALNNRNILSFLKLNGFYATEQEIVAIIRRLDIDADQKITYDEFIDAMRPVIVSGDEPTYSSSIHKSPSRFEEEKKQFQHSQTFQGSPSRPRSPLRESKFGETQGSLLSVPQTSTYKPTSSPSRYEEPRYTHSSPIRPKTDVSRELYSKSSQKSPSRYQYSSPARGGQTSSLVSSYGQ